MSQEPLFQIVFQRLSPSSCQSSDAVQLALKLDGSKLEGRSIRVKRSLKKSENKAAKGGSAKGPAPERARRQRRVGARRKSSASFSGIKVDPNTKTKKKQAKKRAKPKRSVHI